jgi:hypothetical protein
MAHEHLLKVYNPRVPNPRASTRISWPALCLALTAVAASVALGLYGPRVGDRTSSPLVPLREVADAVDSIAQRMSVEASRRPADAQLPTMQDAARVCKDALSAPLQPPDLRDLGLRIVMAGPVPIPGSTAGVALLYESDESDAPIDAAPRAQPEETSGNGSVPPRMSIAPGPSAQPAQRRDVVLAVARDHGAFAIYDEYGRAQPLGIARSVLEESEYGTWAVMVWSDGELLFVAWAPDAALLQRLRSELGAP